MISVDVALQTVYLVHMNPDYLLFMSYSTVYVFVMQILFTAFRAE